MENEYNLPRRGVLGTIGIGVAGGLWIGSGWAMPGVPPMGGEEPSTPETRTIEWDSRLGSESATRQCADDERACWDWVLTPGGEPTFQTVGQLDVYFSNGTTTSVVGTQSGRGAHHFTVCTFGGGEVAHAEVDVIGGGNNAHLTISDSRCVETDVTYWQLDFGVGAEPPIPPSYYPDDFMAGLGNTIEGVTANPDHRRQNETGQLGDVEIEENAFGFDSIEEPTEATVTFTVDDNASEREFHLALFELPGAFDLNELDEQEYIRHTSATVGGGEQESLAIDLDID